MGATAEPELEAAVEEVESEGPLADAQNEEIPEDATPPEDLEETETEAELSEPETITKEEHEKLLKSLEARLGESHRQKLENERTKAKTEAEAAAFQQRQAQADLVRRGAVAQELNRLVQNGADNGQLDENHMQQLAVALDAAAFQNIHEQYAQQFEWKLGEDYPDFSIPTKLSSRLTQAVRSYDRAEQANTWLDIMKEAIREEVRGELEKEQESAQEAAKVKQTSEQRQSRAQPTRDLPAGTSSSITRLTSAEIQAMPASFWKNLKDEEKEQITRNVAEVDGRVGANKVRPEVAARWARRS